MDISKTVFSMLIFTSINLYCEISFLNVSLHLFFLGKQSFRK